MSQDSNTTNDTNPKPRLHIARPKDAPPAPPVPDSASPAPAPDAPAAVPRFSFARKKAAEAAPSAAPAPALPSPATPRPPSGSTNSPLKRPPPGSRLFAAHELAAPEGAAMPAPLTPVASEADAPAPRPKYKRPSRNFKPLLIIILVLIVGGESAYILLPYILPQGERSGAASQANPVVVGSAAPAASAAVITATGPASTPAAKFLQTMSVDFVDAGANPKLSISGQIFHPGQVIDKASGLKWILIDDKNQQMEFVDGQGQHYIKRF